jgi:hypothetical protein
VIGGVVGDVPTRGAGPRVQPGIERHLSR